MNSGWVSVAFCPCIWWQSSLPREVGPHHLRGAPCRHLCSCVPVFLFSTAFQLPPLQKSAQYNQGCVWAKANNHLVSMFQDLAVLQVPVCAVMGCARKAHGPTCLQKLMTCAGQRLGCECHHMIQAGDCSAWGRGGHSSFPICIPASCVSALVSGGLELQPVYMHVFLLLLRHGYLNPEV